MHAALFCITILSTACLTSTIKSTTPAKQKKTINVQSNTVIGTLGLLNWDPFYANLPINKGCNASSTGDACESTPNPYSLNYCKNLMYFKTPVCGGFSCYFDANKKQCAGQCSNTVLETCVSTVVNPQDDSDCTCATSNAYFTSQYNSKTGVNIIDLPTCDASSCRGNSCSFKYISVNRVSDQVLYGFCNNDRFGYSQN